MAEPPLHLIIGNYNTSSWSLRAWLVLRLARLAFIETRIPLRMAETPGRIAAVSPSGKLPVLLAEGVPIWDSLAIAEFVAELEPGIWPLDPIARAEARAVSAEVHSGFADLRRLMPMDVVGRFSSPGRLPRGLAADVDRIKAICGHCRARFAPHGPFLFGAFSIADCMMAPVAARLVTHGVPLDGTVEDYVDSVMSWPDMVTWCDAAAAEQAEREAQGSLGVVAITRPGRVLGREAADQATTPATPTDLAAPEHATPTAVASAAAAPPVEPQRAGLDLQPTDDETAGQIEQAMLTGVMTSAAASAPTDAGTSAATSRADDPAANSGGDAHDCDRAAASAEQDRSAAVAEGRSAPSPAAVPSDAPTRSDQPPPRRRLFESVAAPEATPPVATDLAPIAAVAEEKKPREPSFAARPAPIDDFEDTRPPARKLGWIRRPVPVEHLEATEERAGDEASPTPQRQPVAPPRAGSAAVKPIGGGILRRR